MGNTKTRDGIFGQLIEFIRSFSKSEIADEGRVDEEKLSADDKILLKQLRDMDKVEKVEENIRKKYGVSVNTTVAKENAAKANEKDKEIVEKTIDEK